MFFLFTVGHGAIFYRLQNRTPDRILGMSDRRCGGYGGPELPFTTEKLHYSAMYDTVHKHVIIHAAFAAGPPAYSTDHLPPKPGRSSSGMSRRETLRILCVFKSPSQLKELVSAISSMACKAVSASSPEQAVACCISDHLVAIVIDSEFLTESGWTVARSIKMVRPDLPILLLAQVHNEDTPHGVAAVATTVPLMVQKLAALVAQHS
jgi:CheY-like chemotaxis protein